MATIFGDSRPNSPVVGEAENYTLGTVFKVVSDGLITDIRWFRWENDGYTSRAVALYLDGNETPLATGAGPTPNVDGWNSVPLSSPVSVTAANTYVAAVLAPNPAAYGGISNLGGTGYDDGTGIRAVTQLEIGGANGTSGNGQGRYRVGGSLALPHSTFNSNGYAVDAVYSPAVADTTPPAAPTGLSAIILQE